MPRMHCMFSIVVLHVLNSLHTKRLSTLIFLEPGSVSDERMTPTFVLVGINSEGVLTQAEGAP